MRLIIPILTAFAVLTVSSPAAADARPAAQRDWAPQETTCREYAPTARHAGRCMMHRYWGDSQWGCLDYLWTRESNWNHLVRDGIPQAKPGHKMVSHGLDYRTNAWVQISWGLSYVRSRYGSPCAAADHFRRKNYY